MFVFLYFYFVSALIDGFRVRVVSPTLANAHIKGTKLVRKNDDLRGKIVHALQRFVLLLTLLLSVLKAIGTAMVD